MEETTTRKLPKIKEGEKPDFISKQELQIFLNQQPKKEWIQKHPSIPTTWLYISIDKIEFLLTYLFGEWYVEIKEIKEMFNSVNCTVRLHYKDYFSKEWKFQDGTGAKGLQMDKGTDVKEGRIKQAAVEMAAPIAETNAIKDAAEKIGRIFGRDLNRKNLINYDVLEKDERFTKLMEDAK